MGNAKAKKKKKSLQKELESYPDLFNRELSWLEFNSRVLFQSLDKKWPLLERLRFLSIYISNLDEFVMKRIGGIKHYLESDYFLHSTDKIKAKKQLQKIKRKIIADNLRCEHSFSLISEELKSENIFLLNWSELELEDKAFCDKYFQDSYYPILTPLSVDAGKHFPFISNLSYSLGIFLENPFEVSEKIFSRVKIPEIALEWVELPSKTNSTSKKFIRSEDIIRNNLKHLYRGIKILDVMPFRLTRNADWDHDDKDTEDLLEMVEESINERRLQGAVRIEVYDDSNKEMLQYLTKELGLSDEDIYISKSNLDYSSLSSLLNLKIPNLHLNEWRPLTPVWAQGDKLIDKIAQKDRLVHHPYESFTGTVEKLIFEAVKDPNVISIKMTLYRTSQESHLTKSLIRAAESGKQVVCLIELKARFDEKRNIDLAKKMEEAGVHVVYGLKGLKTHSKMTMIVRKEGFILRTYCHIGTGNYNAKTAKLYTDLGLFTSDQRITKEVSELFNYLTGTSLKSDYKYMLVSPINSKSQFIAKIKKQIKRAKKGEKAYIFAKMNSLEDSKIIKTLYDASSEGVKIDLVVRGLCSLVPGDEQYSKNIRVLSFIGRFLEHSRFYYFKGESHEEDEYYIGSADWMHRNLHSRVEALVPIFSRHIKERLNIYKEMMTSPEVSAWELCKDGTYSRRKIKSGQEEDLQEKLMQFYSELNNEK